MHPSTLLLLFERLNRVHFQNALRVPSLRWNSRLSSSAGRFFPRSPYRLDEGGPCIEIATYLLSLEDGFEHLVDTLVHEMLHQALWQAGRPFGHTPEFRRLSRQLGVSVHNPVPKHEPKKHVYLCPHCQSEFRTRRRLRRLSACRRCCDTLAQGRYDHRFKLLYAGLCEWTTTRRAEALKPETAWQQWLSEGRPLPRLLQLEQTIRE